jgi:hypothetical protein
MPAVAATVTGRSVSPMPTAALRAIRDGPSTLAAPASMSQAGGLSRLG